MIFIFIITFLFISGTIPKKVTGKRFGSPRLFLLCVQRGLDRFGQVLCLASAPIMQEQDSRVLVRYVAWMRVVASLTRARHAVEPTTRFAEFGGLSCSGMLDTYSLGQKAFPQCRLSCSQLARLVRNQDIVWKIRLRL